MRENWIHIPSKLVPAGQHAGCQTIYRMISKSLQFSPDKNLKFLTVFNKNKILLCSTNRFSQFFRSAMHPQAILIDINPDIKKQ